MVKTREIFLALSRFSRILPGVFGTRLARRAMAERPAQRARPASLDARVSTLDLPKRRLRYWVNLTGLAVGKDGTVFVGTEYALYLISPGGFVAHVAGCEEYPDRSDESRLCADGEGADARFNLLRGLAADSDGSLLVADTHNSRLARVTPQGTVSTVAGSAGEGGVAHADGVGAAARLSWPFGIVMVGDGTIYLSDYNKHCICKMMLADGADRELARKLMTQHLQLLVAVAVRDKDASEEEEEGEEEEEEFRPITKEEEEFRSITKKKCREMLVPIFGVARVNEHKEHISLEVTRLVGEYREMEAEALTEVIEGCRALTEEEVKAMSVTKNAVSILCGNGERGFADGQGADARFNCPAGLALDADGNLIVADFQNHCIRKVTLPDGRVSTVAGSREGRAGFADGEGTAARFNGPIGVAVDGNNTILVADKSNNRVRKIAGEGAQVTTLAGSSEAGTADGEGISARFSCPWALALDERGRLLVGESRGNLRVVEASLAPPRHLVVHNPPRIVLEDYAQLLEDTELADVTFAVDGHRFLAHRCVLAARSAYFSGLFKSGRGMREGGSSAGGQDIVLEEVSAGAFRVLLAYLYANRLPEEEACGQGLGVGEMVKVADRFQASGLYEHCLVQFREGMEVETAIERLVQAHVSGLVALQKGAMEYVVRNFHRYNSRMICLSR